VRCGRGRRAMADTGAKRVPNTFTVRQVFSRPIAIMRKRTIIWIDVQQRPPKLTQVRKLRPRKFKMRREEQVVGQHVKYI
jgi:hypothetical protein